MDEERKGGRDHCINIMARSSTLYLANVHIHGTALAELFSRVLFIIFSDG